MYAGNLLVSSIPLKNILHLWEENDILIFLIDLDNYDTLSTEYLNNTEKEDLEKLQTLYFKKRFIVSRTVLKHILRCLLKLESILDISTYKDRYGEVHILNHEELHICISYSEDIVALAVSKTRVGIDIEAKRPLALKNTLKYLQTTSSYTGDSVSDTNFLKMWTLKEAYCKFSNKGMLSSLYKEPDFNNAWYSNYTLNNKYIFSIVTDSNPHTISISRLEILTIV
ncbi:4'-phosphopantetheinyl transferase [Methanosarcina horonobensis HB-1 = JCM 15518]|uniref:4'-phosphopantetheinyl transferase n=1 Tax=Methanosarcina horonobensis HB-1 = JCM 15518 TaxID=1434110 RepID=A0A0E3S9C8_9EURY|nr:4'-phosphopantetheinyl transferase superfamily protein [Methanosarcina horonobensis]AKB77291.1 4'-phosphopantetheinyl transferase [Methanosarcina horonobensis HB-1 = JCM 15518]